MDLETKIIFVKKLIENKEKCGEYFTIFNHIWPFTTINMKEYLKPYNLENKICVTLQGSSDHLLELALKKPKQIIGFDINPLTSEYGYLKLAAIKGLKSYQEYLNFFRFNGIDYSSVFAEETFKTISNYLPKESQIFWQEIFANYSSCQIRENLFSKDEGNINELKGCLNYLSANNYNYLKDNIDNINFSFINTDVKDLTSKLPCKVDFITLSNLIIYAEQLFPENTLENWQKLIENLATKLNKDGYIMGGYLYDIENENDYRQIYHKEKRDKVFNLPKYSYEYVTRTTDLARMSKSQSHDATLVYTK